MRTDWRLQGLLYLAGLLASAQFAKISLTMTELQTLFAAQSGAVPFLVSGVSIMGIVFGATAGVIVARFGVRRVLLAGLGLGAAISLAEATLPAFPLFGLLRLAEGASHLSIVVAAPTLMAEVASDRHRPVAMGLWGTFFGIGFTLAAFAAPPLLAAFGPAGVYGAHGVAMAALAAILLPLLPRGVAARSDGLGWVQRHRRIYGTLHVLAPAVGFFWHTVMFLALLTFLPGFVGGWTAPILPVVALVGTFAGGSLGTRFAPRRILLTGFVVTAIGALLLILVPEAARIYVAIPLMAVIGIAPGASFASVPALNATAADRALANGAMAQLGNVGTFSSTPLFALTVPFGLAGPAGLVLAISTLGALVVWQVYRRI